MTLEHVAHTPTLVELIDCLGQHGLLVGVSAEDAQLAPVRHERGVAQGALDGRLKTDGPIQEGCTWF